MRLFVVLVGLLGGLLALLASVSMTMARQDEPEQNAWLVTARSENTIAGRVQDVEIVRLLVGENAIETIVSDLNMVYRISFHPDGRTIVYDTANELPTAIPVPNGQVQTDYYHQIYIKEVGPNPARPLVQGIPNAYAPAWSPDGEWIAFIGGESSYELDQFNGLRYVQDYYLYKIRPDGSELTQLAPSMENGRVQWSPDGTRLAFPALSDTDFPSGDIYIIDADGQNLRQLTFDPANDLSPYFSPDGNDIVFLSDRGNNGFDFDVWTMTAEGTLPRRLYQTTGSSGAVAWSPDGKRVASVLDRYYIDINSGQAPPTSVLNPAIISSQPDYDPNLLPIYQYNIQVTDTETFASQRATPIDRYNYWAPAWSPPVNLLWDGYPGIVLGVALALVGLARVRWQQLPPPPAAPFFRLRR